MHFERVEVNDVVYSIVYGEGKVVFKVKDSDKMSGFYSFEVLYESGQRFFYTDDGVPNWCSIGNAGCQTIWYKDEIDLLDEDFSPSDGELSKKKITKLRAKGKLEMKCPTGIWRNVEGCPEREFLRAIANEKFHLFRKQKDL